MHFRAFCSAVSSLAIAAALLLRPPAALADHLPIIDLEPVLTTAGVGNNQPVTNDLNLAGTVTIPIAKGFSASYDRILNGVYHNTFAPVIIPAVGPVQPGSYNDIVQQYRIDYAFKGFNIEPGLATRHRVCCPGSGDPNGLASVEWHQAYLALTYISHPIDFLHNTVLVLDITGHSANHNPPPNALLFEQAITSPLSPVPDIGKHEYGTSQVAQIITPIDGKHGFSTTATYLWGSLDYFENFPVPLNYGVVVFTANKQFNKYFGLTLRQANLWQRPNQNTPFPGNAIHVIDWSLVADIHLNLNTLFK